MTTATVVSNGIEALNSKGSGKLRRSFPALGGVRKPRYGAADRIAGRQRGEFGPLSANRPGLAIDELPLMLSWYRSRDLEKVTLATHWFVSIDIRMRLADLVDVLRQGNLDEVENAKRLLAAFSELGLKTVVALLDDPELHRIAEEILAEMDEYVLPHLLRWIERSDSYNIRIGIYRALAGRLCDQRAKRALADGLRSPDNLEAAFVCQALLESGLKGRRILQVVFPERQSQVT